MRGATLNSAQWIANKALTAIAMLVVAHYLTPAEYGVGAQALAIFSFLALLPPLSVGDVLIAHPKNFGRLAASAARLATVLAMCSMVLTLASIPVVVLWFTDDPSRWLAGLLAILAIRPILEARLMLPIAFLRLSLAYPRIATIDGLVQMGATCLSVAMAALGGRAASLVVPQVIGTGVRAAIYVRQSRIRLESPVRATRVRYLFRQFVRASGAQYIHNVLVMLEVLVLGLVAGQYQTGLFGLAFTIACQANSIIAYQLGVVLQPVFSRLQNDVNRQVTGFLKAQRVLSAVCIPICCAQAILAEPLFRLLLAEKWQPAIPIFQIISLSQAFYFASGPAMACLRGQRRFGTLLVWQSIQFVVSVPIYWFGASEGAAVGVAIASGIVWACSTILVVWMCTTPSPSRRAWDSIAIFLNPLLVCVPLFAATLFVTRWAGGFGTLGDVASILVMGPVAILTAIFVIRFTHKEIRVTLDGLVRQAINRVCRTRGT